MVGTNQPVSNVSIGLQDSNGVTYLPAHVTGSDGKYSWTVPVGGSYTVTPSLIGGNYWFDPQNATNISSTQTVNFTANPVTYVYLLHGIGQNASAMSALYQGLTAPGTGIDLRKYYVDPVGPNTGFTFACASSCGVVHLSTESPWEYHSCRVQYGRLDRVRSDCQQLYRSSYWAPCHCGDHPGHTQPRISIFQYRLQRNKCL